MPPLLPHADVAHDASQQARAQQCYAMRILRRHVRGERAERVMMRCARRYMRDARDEKELCVGVTLYRR